MEVQLSPELQAKVERAAAENKSGAEEYVKQLVEHHVHHDEGMAQQIGIDGAVPEGQAETRGENIFKLYPEEFGVQSFVWHWFRSREWDREVHGRRLTGRKKTKT
jgi:hypothetical protein